MFRFPRQPPAPRRHHLRASSSISHQLRETPGSHLDLEEIDLTLFRAPREQLWVPPASRAVFGGQVLGQALHAASRTVEQALGPHGDRRFTPVSLHSYFLKRGVPSSDIVYRVRKDADLRSYASRTVDAIQRGETIFTMQTQFARTPSSGLSHASEMPSGVPPPEECPSMHDQLTALLARAPATLQPLIQKQLVAPVEVRYACGVSPDLLEPHPAAQPARQLLWIRIRDPIGRTRLDECCAAYLSAQPLLLTALRPHGIQFPSPRLGAIATLDHSMWFHGPFRCDDWLLYEITSPHAGAGRALCFGHLYARDGRLVVSCAQQGMIRLAKPSVAGAAASLGIRAARLVDRLFGRSG